MHEHSVAIIKNCIQSQYYIFNFDLQTDDYRHSSFIPYSRMKVI